MKKRFFGFYYKHQNKDGYTIAVIDSVANEGPMVQIVDNDKSYQLKDPKQVKCSFEGIEFNVKQDDLTITGKISYGPLLKAKKNIMSYYRFLPIECKHFIYSMYQNLNGEITINDKVISFEDGNGYIEGDRGRNFPRKYLWLNAINSECSITLAIATIPLGLFKILGTTCLISSKGKEYRFGTYNFAKAKLVSKDHVIVKKGKYVLDIIIKNKDGHALRAPIKGDMVRFIHECPSLEIEYTLKRKDEVILDIKHPYASFEYTF